MALSVGAKRRCTLLTICAASTALPSVTAATLMSLAGWMAAALPLVLLGAGVVPAGAGVVAAGAGVVAAGIGGVDAGAVVAGVAGAGLASCSFLPHALSI